MARRIPGAFVPVSVGLPRDPAIRRAGPSAELLYIRGLIYCGQNQTDGIIPDFDLPVVAVGLPHGRRLAAKLTAEGLWMATDDGFSVTAWRKWNRSTKEREEAREAKVLGAQKTNHTRYHKGKPDPECPFCQSDTTTGEVA